MFSEACGQRFRISADNLAANIGASEEFAQAVAGQALEWCNSSVPARGELLLKGLAAEFEQSDYSCSERYQQSKLI
jgi:elongation factor P hydroxylase